MAAAGGTSTADPRTRGGDSARASRGARARMLSGQAGQLALYVGVPFLSSLAPLVVIPAITSRYGANGWASIAVAMSVGLAGSVIAELGWAIVGPQRVARSVAEAPRLYELALASRIVAVGTGAPIVAAISACLAREHRAAAAILAIGILLGALSPSWYFTGLGRPGRILLTETLPKMLLALVAAGVIASGGPLEAYGAALVLAASCSVWLAAWSGGTCAWPSRVAFRAVPSAIREQAVVVAGRGVTTLYKALPTAMLAGVAPAAVPAYAAIDRPMRMGLQFLAAVPQRLQAWLGVAEPTHIARRVRAVLLLNVALGIVAGAVFAAAMSPVAEVLFTGTVHVAPSLAALGGLLVVLVCASRGCGLALVALGAASWTSGAAVAAAIVAVPGVVVAGGVAGAGGAVGALVVAEGVANVVQIIVLVRRLRSSVHGADS